MIVLPFPDACLSGHNTGHWSKKARVIATHRAWAFHATRAAKATVPVDGDISIKFRFVPADRLRRPDQLSRAHQAVHRWDRRSARDQ